MVASEMSRPENRGRVIWVLASSRPDLIEVDLKRPGRVDLKVPIFPTSSPEEGYQLLRSLAKRSEEHTSELQSHSDLVCRLLLEKKKQKNLQRMDRQCCSERIIKECGTWADRRHHD